MKTLFLIPARGGSKGFPGKNIAVLAGIPLVGWAARLACQAAAAHPGSSVVCSTDDAAIAEAARAWGAEVPFLRPPEMATDDAKSIDVVIHALDQSAEKFEVVVVLQPTSPLTDLEDVLGALDRFAQLGCPVIGVSEAQHPPEWCCRLTDGGVIERVLPETMPHRRQMSEALYYPNGAIYVASEAQVRAGGFWGPQTRAYVMPPDRSVDIDLPVDLTMAETLLASRAVPTIEVGGTTVGPGSPCFVIAEAGVNHNGSLDAALRLVDAAAEAGADAVKFQTFRTEKLVSLAAPKADYQQTNTGDASGQFEMLRELELTADQHRKIQARCRDKGIIFLSTPFDTESLDLLLELGVPALKIGSGEITNHEFLGALAASRLPLIMSTGMSSMDEVDKALTVVRSRGATSIALLHCVSNYPTAPRDCNLCAMDSMRKAFGVPTGWSDHTLGIHISIAAAARGATIVEKHLTLDRGLPGPDHAASLEPGELRTLVECIRDVELSLGMGAKVPSSSEGNTAAVARRSIHAARAIRAGHQITRQDLVMLRPGTGMPAGRTDEVVGCTASRDIQAGSALSEEDLL